MNMLRNCAALVLLAAIGLHAREDPDWPHAHPTQAPTDPTFSIFSTHDLMLKILGGKQDGDWRDESRSACVWFLWKSRDGADGPRQRAKLAHAIFKKLKH